MPRDAIVDKDQSDEGCLLGPRLMLSLMHVLRRHGDDIASVNDDYSSASGGLSSKDHRQRYHHTAPYTAEVWSRVEVEFRALIHAPPEAMDTLLGHRQCCSSGGGYSATGVGQQDPNLPDFNAQTLHSKWVYLQQQVPIQHRYVST